MALTVFQGSVVAQVLGAFSGSVVSGLLGGLYLFPTWAGYAKGPNRKAGGGVLLAASVGFSVALLIGLPMAAYLLNQSSIGAFGYITQFFFASTIAGVASGLLGMGMVKALKLGGTGMGAAAFGTPIKTETPE